MRQQYGRHGEEIAALREFLSREQRACCAEEVRLFEFRRPEGTSVRWANEVQRTECFNDSSDDETTNEQCVISSKSSQVAKESADLP